MLYTFSLPRRAWDDSQAEIVFRVAAEKKKEPARFLSSERDRRPVYVSAMLVSVSALFHNESQNDKGAGPSAQGTAYRGTRASALIPIELEAYRPGVSVLRFFHLISRILVARGNGRVAVNLALWNGQEAPDVARLITSPVFPER